MPILSFTDVHGRHLLLDHDDVRRIELHPRKPIAHVHTYDGQQYEVHGTDAARVANAFVGASDYRRAATPLPGSAPPTDDARPPAEHYGPPPGGYLAVEGPPGVVEPLASALLDTEVRSVDEADIPEGAVVLDTYEADER